jgi:hypothetical protein
MVRATFACSSDGRPVPRQAGKMGDAGRLVQISAHGAGSAERDGARLTLGWRQRFC